jgi:hypothetical protein
VLDIVLTDAAEVVPAARPRFFVLPLGLGLLSVATALGVLGLTVWARWRVSLCCSGAHFQQAAGLRAAIGLVLIALYQLVSSSRRDSGCPTGIRRVW